MTSAALAFDRLAYVDRLTSEGIDERQARAHAAALEIALGETVATKTDLRDTGRELRSETETLGRDLRSEMAALGQELRSEMKVLARDLRSEMADLRTQMDAKIGQVETRLEAKIETTAAGLKVDILRWLLVTQAALGGFLFAALKFAH